jgi:hypothetical protein
VAISYGTPEYDPARQSRSAFDAAMGAPQRNQATPVGGPQKADPSGPYKIPGPRNNGADTQHEAFLNTTLAGGGLVGDAMQRRGGASAGSSRNVSGGNLANLQGYDAGNFGNPDVQTLKYRAGRIINDYFDGSSDSIQRAMQDPRWMNDPDLSRAQFNGEDKINFLGALSEDGGVPVNWIDVIQGWENGRGNPLAQWIDEANSGGGGQAPASGGGGVNLAPSALLRAISQGGNGNDTLAKIQAEIQALINGGGSPLAMDAFNGAMR